MEGVFLDSRYKKLAFADITNIKKVEDRIMNLMRSDFASEERELAPSKSQVSQPQEREAQASFDAKFEKVRKTAHVSITGPHTDMRLFMEELFIPREENNLAWWRGHNQLLPKLQEKTRKFLCIPAIYHLYHP